MFQEAQVSQGLVEVLAKAHVRGLKPEHHLAIAFRVKHHDFKGAPRVISYSESQTKRRWNEVQDFFLPILGLPRHDEVLTGIWIVLHALCCTAPSFALLENDSRFSSAAS
jgi:hypothetical protein